MEGTPVFSICIPVYNAEKYLKSCVNSALSQTFMSFEIIIVDDGSSDKSVMFCDEFANNHDNITAVHINNSGPLLARREAVRYSCGEYIVFLDADDRLHKDTLKKCYRAIQCNDFPDIVGFNMTSDSSFKSHSIDIEIPCGLTDLGHFNVIRTASCLGKLNNLCGKAIKRILFDVKADYSIYSKMRLGEDYLQMLPIIDAANTFFYLCEPLYFYRRSDNSGTFHFSKSQIRDIELVSTKILEYGNKWKMDNTAVQGVLLQYCYLLKILYLDSTINKKDKKALIR